MQIEKPITLDLLEVTKPLTSTTSDMPVVETKPDSSPAPDKAKDGKDAAPEAKKPEGEKAAPAKSEAQEKPEDSAANEDEGVELEAEADVRAEQKEPSKKSKGVQKRIDELIRQREDERRSREATEARLDRALAAVERLTGKPAAEAKQELAEEDPEPTRPVRAQFPDDTAFEQARDDYTEGKARWIARREIKATIVESERKAAEARTLEEQQIVHKSYKERVDKVSEKYEDFHEVAESPDVAISIPMAHAIMSSEYGPEIQYLLGKEPAEAERISKLSVPQQLLALGRMEAKLAIGATPKTDTPAEPAAKPAAPAKSATVSNAPAPVKPTRAGNAEQQKPLEELSMEEYAARRKPQLAAEQRRGVR